MSAIDDMQLLAKAGPFIGPRGGKWADPKHTIPWKEGAAKPKRRRQKTAGVVSAAKQEGFARSKKVAADLKANYEEWKYNRGAVGQKTRAEYTAHLKEHREKFGSFPEGHTTPSAEKPESKPKKPMFTGSGADRFLKRTQQKIAQAREAQAPAKPKKAKRPTFKAAKQAVMDHLEKQGWTVKRGLKVPHATSPDGDVKLWFKAQAIHHSHPSAGFGAARSVHFEAMPDIRDMSPEDFVRNAVQFAKKGHDMGNLSKGAGHKYKTKKMGPGGKWIYSYDEPAKGSEDPAAQHKGREHYEDGQIKIERGRGPGGFHGTHSDHRKAYKQAQASGVDALSARGLHHAAKYAAKLGDEKMLGSIHSAAKSKSATLGGSTLTPGYEGDDLGEARYLAKEYGEGGPSGSKPHRVSTMKNPAKDQDYKRFKHRTGYVSPADYEKRRKKSMSAIDLLKAHGKKRSKQDIVQELIAQMTAKQAPLPPMRRRGATVPPRVRSRQPHQEARPLAEQRQSARTRKTPKNLRGRMTGKQELPPLQRRSGVPPRVRSRQPHQEPRPLAEQRQSARTRKVPKNLRGRMVGKQEPQTRGAPGATPASPARTREMGQVARESRATPRTQRSPAERIVQRATRKDLMRQISGRMTAKQEGKRPQGAREALTTRYKKETARARSQGPLGQAARAISGSRPSPNVVEQVARHFRGQMTAKQGPGTQGLARSMVDPSGRVLLQKGLYDFKGYDRKNDRALPARYLFDYLCAFVEEAYEHEKKEPAHKNISARDLPMAMARCIMNELVQCLPKNPNLMRACNRYKCNQDTIAQLLVSKGILKPKSDTLWTDSDSAAAMGAGGILAESEVMAYSLPPAPFIKSDPFAPTGRPLAPPVQHENLAGHIPNDRMDPAAALSMRKATEMNEMWFGSELLPAGATVAYDCPVHSGRDMTKSQNLWNPMQPCRCRKAA